MTGLLGGLQEFPTTADVGDLSKTSDDMVADALKAAQTVLLTPITISPEIATEPIARRKANDKVKRGQKPAQTKGTLDALWNRSSKDTMATVDPAPAVAVDRSVATVKEGQLQISRVTNAGELQHIFSHIRMEYAVRWVVLEGGPGLPEVRAGPAANSVAKSKSSANGKGPEKTKKGGKAVSAKGKRRVLNEESQEAEVEAGVTARWVRLEEVGDAKSV
jgi:hypothetical protein